jgi:hypothetical protein
MHKFKVIQRRLLTNWAIPQRMDAGLRMAAAAKTAASANLDGV